MKNKRKSDNPVENDFSNNKTITQHKNNINNATNNSTKSDFKNVLFKNKGPTEVFNKSDRIIFKRSSLSLKSNQIYSSRRMSKLSSDKTLDANEEKIHKRNNIKTNNVNFRESLKSQNIDQDNLQKYEHKNKYSDLNKASKFYFRGKSCEEFSLYTNEKTPSKIRTLTKEKKTNVKFDAFSTFKSKNKNYSDIISLNKNYASNKNINCDSNEEGNLTVNTKQKINEKEILDYEQNFFIAGQSNPNVSKAKYLSSDWNEKKILFKNTCNKNKNFFSSNLMNARKLTGFNFFKSKIFNEKNNNKINLEDSLEKEKGEKISIKLPYKKINNTKSSSNKDIGKENIGTTNKIKKLSIKNPFENPCYSKLKHNIINDKTTEKEIYKNNINTKNKGNDEHYPPSWIHTKFLNQENSAMNSSNYIKSTKHTYSSIYKSMDCSNSNNLKSNKSKKEPSNDFNQNKSLSTKIYSPEDLHFFFVEVNKVNKGLSVKFDKLDEINESFTEKFL